MPQLTNLSSGSVCRSPASLPGLAVVSQNKKKPPEIERTRPDNARIGFCAKRDPFEIFEELPERGCERRLERFSLSLLALLRTSDGHPECR